MPPANSFQSYIVWVRMSLKNFKMTAVADYGTAFAFLNLPIAMISPTKFRYNPTVSFGKRFCLKNLKVADIFGVRIERI